MMMAQLAGQDSLWDIVDNISVQALLVPDKFLDVYLILIDISNLFGFDSPQLAAGITSFSYADLFSSLFR